MSNHAIGINLKLLREARESIFHVMMNLDNPHRDDLAMALEAVRYAHENWGHCDPKILHTWLKTANDNIEHVIKSLEKQP